MINYKLYGTLEEMLAHAEEINKEYSTKYLEQEYNEDNFAWYTSIHINGSSGSYRAFRSFFINACRNAKTVEELTDLGITVCVRNGYISYTDEKTIRKSILVKTTDELINAIDELTEFYKGKDVSVDVSYDNSTDYVCRVLKGTRKVDRFRAREIARERQTLLDEANEIFLIEMEKTRGYFVKFTKYGYRYSNYINWSTKRFLTEKEAKPLMKKLESKGYQFTLVKKSTKKD